MTALVMSTITAIISAGIGVAIWALQRKVDRMEKEAEKHNAQSIRIRAAERDLLFAEAKISALTARVLRGEIVNGDLERAEKDLQEKKKTLTDITNEIIAEYMEGGKV